MRRIILRIIGDAGLVVAGLAFGAYAQSQAFGDFMLVRLQEKDKAGANLCAAYDIDHKGGIVGKWSQAEDGRCHMREFVRGRLVQMIRATVTE